MLSQTDIQSADLSFYPPLGKKSLKRSVFLIAKKGVLLKGITITTRKGQEYPKVDVPAILEVLCPTKIWTGLSGQEG